MFYDTLTHLKNNKRKTGLEIALDTYLMDCRARRLSPSTLVHYREQLLPFLRFVGEFGVITPGTVTGHHIRAYLVSLQERGLKDTSQHAAARPIRAFFNFLVREEVIDVSPMRNVQMPRLAKRIMPAFTKEEVEKLLDTCTHLRDKAMILCLIDSGCRSSEFTALRVEDVDMRAGIIRIKNGKGGKDRITYIGAKARKVLLRYLLERGEVAPIDPLWISFNTGKGLTHYGLRLILHRLGKRADIQPCSPHVFRRTCALWSLRAGMNIFALQQMMGHTDLTTLQRYLALVEADLEQAHRSHGAVDNMM